MTDKVNPSINRPAEAFKTAGAIALAGGAKNGYISPTNSPSELSVQDGGINESNLNQFNESHSASSFDVTIEGGEAFVYGSWSAIDTTTTVTLASSTNNQTVYVGWNKDGSDDVIVGLNSAFENASGNTDEKIPLWEFDTDGSGVVAVRNKRIIGKVVNGRHITDTASVSTNTATTGEQIIFVDSTGGPVTITLSTADLLNGSEIVISDSGGSSKNNNITIDTEGSSSIDGSSSITVDQNYGSQRISSDGSNWFTSGGGAGGGLTVADSGTITLSTSSSPAFDGILSDVSTDQTVKIVEVNLYISSDPSFSGDYAWNKDYGQQWDDSDSAVDVNITVNWDTDPGSDLTVAYEVLVR